ncbi:peptidase S46 [Roseospira marina]|uniref:Peptidase S46 n=1 Tax=Roseospira marina TaxID=140057 RepID=A0A5M6IFZ9_9PROT|nr:S49 family peptidase [Roseospira marina]KAA5607226.1 peptidase S46 [Roseospira marina]MBB4312623.1 protease-4 [Roseospira marina]MBB5085361.1 protease-4 [Roseospira marina]
MLRFFGKVIVGLLAIVGTLVVVLAVAAWFLVPQVMPRKEPLPGSFVLTVDLDRPLLEGERGGWFGGADSDTLPLRTLLDGLDLAANDDRVLGLVARVQAPEMGLAQAQEVRDAVHAFRANGKPTYIYADTMPAAGQSGTLAYYLASAFGEIWMQPSGEVGLTGVALESPFLADALAEIGIAFEASTRQEYKGALASLSEASMPAPQQENLGRFVASWFDQMKADISAARGLTLEALDAQIDSAPLLVSDAVQAGLVDRAGYRDQFRAAVRESLGEQSRLTIADYMDRRDDARSETSRRIALVHGVGMVVPGASDEVSPFGGPRLLRADDLVDAIDSAVKDERVAAIVLRLDSPGGDYVASDTARRAVALARERGTPVIISMGNTVASGGYFIALEGDQILASPGTLTGSIGVAAGKPVLRGLWENMGVTWARLAEGRNAGMWSLNEPFSIAARQALDQRLDAIYADFTRRVGAARNLDGDRLDQAARGRVFTGVDALEAGLVDQLGGLRAALRVAREAAAIPADEPVVVAPYPEPDDPLNRLLRVLKNPSALPGLAQSLAGVPESDLRALARVAVLLEPVLEPLARVTAGMGTGAAALRYGGPETDGRP